MHDTVPVVPAGYGQVGVAVAGLVTFCELACVFLVGLEQRAGHQQALVEQLPFGADFNRLVQFGAEDLVGIAVQHRREPAILRGDTVQFGADRVRRRGVGRIDTGVRQRLVDNAEVVIRQPEIRRLRTERVRFTVHRRKPVRVDAVIVIADAAIQEQHVVPVGGVEHVNALGIDADIGRKAGELRIGAERKIGELRAEDIDAGHRSAGVGAAGQRFRHQPVIFIEADAFARRFDAGDRIVPPRAGIELEGRLGLVGQHVGDLITALRIGGERPQQRIRIGNERRFRQRADIIEHRALQPGLVAQDQIGRDRDFDIGGPDVLLDAVVIAIDEAVEIIAAGAEIRERAAGRVGVWRPFPAGNTARRSPATHADWCGCSSR